MSELFNLFRGLGCCFACVLRFLGVDDKASYLDPSAALKKKFGVETSQSQVKHVKENPCVSCLGLLQPPYSDQILDQIAEDFLKFKDEETFSLALSVPSALLLREHSLQIVLKESPHNTFPPPPPALKDVWRWSFLHRLETPTFKCFPQSPLTLSLNFTYADELQECSSLCKISTKHFNPVKAAEIGYPKKTVETVLDSVIPPVFKRHYQTPPTVPTVALTCPGVTGVRAPLNIAGRYNKWSRELPQTPWVLNGERKMESSVQELICGHLQTLTNATYIRFSSSGREDVDVRTLGNGRPFNVELGNPSKSYFTFQEMRHVENLINKESDGKIHVRDLQIVKKEDLTHLKKGEEEKTKEYSALCVLLGGSTVTELQCKTVEEHCPVTIEQSTPIRVLHRRPVAVRQRRILNMKFKFLPDDSSKFVLNMETEAGTYIKEFIHGDFGRTKPSLSDLLGGAEVDIVALDVLNICLDWPSPVDYSNLDVS